MLCPGLLVSRVSVQMLLRGLGGAWGARGLFHSALSTGIGCSPGLSPALGLPRAARAAQGCKSPWYGGPSRGGFLTKSGSWHSLPSGVQTFRTGLLAAWAESGHITRAAGHRVLPVGGCSSSGQVLWPTWTSVLCPTLASSSRYKTGKNKWFFQKLRF